MSKLWHPFTRYPLSGEPQFPLVVKARGAYLFLEDGSRLFDAISSWWTIIHGHGIAKLRRAVNQQLKKLDHVIFAGFRHPAAEKLAERLAELTGYERIFFSDNGSTAVEVAVKLAIQYNYNTSGKQTTIYTLEQAYHGDTFGAMAAAGKNLFTRPFTDYLFTVKQLPVPVPENREKIRQQLKKIRQEKPLTLLYEPLVQGAGGMLMHEPALLNEILAAFREAGATLIADEVFTGFFRTGTLLASEQLAIRPDLVALAKGITGGFLPLGATLTNNKIFDAFRGMEGDKTFYHGHSYTGYPAACAAAVANLDLLVSSDSRSKIKTMHQLMGELKQEISRLPQCHNVRRCGGILAFEIGEDRGGYTDSRRDWLYGFFFRRGVLLRPLGNTIYLVPPLCSSGRDFELVVKALCELNHPPR